ncbi:MAG TPA: hypothetical protein VLC98_06075 [Phnomibacter sp.]|nr:hypothetical protein [Phnomibacter sp.]
MQIRNSLLVAIMLLATMYSSAQTTYLPLWAKEHWLLDRMEIKAQRNNQLNLSTVKPYMRKASVEVADSFAIWLHAGKNPANLSEVDEYNLNRLQANSSEYSMFSADGMPGWKSKKPWGKTFFATQANLVELNKKDFYLSINPAINIQQSIESDYDEPVYHRAFGATARGLIAKRVGFNFLVTANGEQGPVQFRRFVAENHAMPGAGRFDSVDGGKSYQYMDFRGSVNTNITQYINVQFGYDKNFIGDGYRSLMLSDFSNPALFLKLNTRIWKLNYTNLFMELTPTPDQDMNGQMKKKYAAMHHLGLNVTKWLNLGFFESIIFARDGHYDFSYLLPVIFYRSIEQQNGSPDNANIGFDFKANVARKLQFYGQVMLDEFVKDEVVGNKQDWWGNKQGFQLGGKYVDAIGIKNLDLQLEFNQVRPFMYQFRDTTGSYASALQPLAHPMGGNLREYITIIRYQPLNRLYLFARGSFWKQGLDSAGYNFGANPNTLYTAVAQGGTRLRGNNYPMFAGMPAKGTNLSLTASFECRENLFVEATGMLRNYKETNKDAVNTTIVTLGVRWNMFRRDYDY